MENQELSQEAITLEDVEIEFVADWEEGKSPKLTDYVRRYPQFASGLTEFVLEFVSIENAVQRMTAAPVVSNEPRTPLSDFLANIQKPANDLNEAREAMGWTQSEFARQLDIPPRAVRLLMRGEISDAPKQSKLTSRLEEVLCCSTYQVHLWLQKAAMPTPDHFKAAGPPQALISQPKTWYEVLIECQKRGELTAAQVAFWLPKKKKQ